ncbi:MAG: CdaR family protein [Spirochaetes bacterium]|nr:CdaR family protein [Spirochaetota bacterium]
MRSKSFLDRLVAEWPAKALSLAAAILLFLFHNYSTLSERFINVPLQAVFANGFTAGQPLPKRVRVSVRGKEKNLATVTEGDIEAIADFTAFNKKGTYRVPIQIKRKGSGEDSNIMEFRVEPIELVVLIEEKIQKRVEVSPRFKGSLLSGYELVQYYVTPSLILVEGPSSRLERLYSIPTEEIDLTGKKDSFSLEVRVLKSDPLLTFPNGDTVEFRGFVQETTILKTFESVSIVVLDLRPDLRLSQSLPKGTVRVQGAHNILDSVGGDQIRLIVDGKSIMHPGTYTLPVRIDTPVGLMVLRFEPTSVTLKVEQVE